MTAGEMGKPLWTEDQWDLLQQSAAAAVRMAGEKTDTRYAVVPHARRVIRAFASSFFIVTRFLPAPKRHDVEIIYANVRYPDEVVDSFCLTSDERMLRLDEWEDAYDTAVSCGHCRQALERGAPAFVAAFGELVRAHRIPVELYRAFLAAMRADVRPRRYADMDDLVANYVYGSASVVGLFLAHVFGPAPGHSLEDALKMADGLGVALQMTNFLRDVGEDMARGRLYLPLDRMQAAGIEPLDPASAVHRKRLDELVATLARENDARYARAEERLDVFEADVRPAVAACIRVYRLLNRRAMSVQDVLANRISVPLGQKLAALPMRKYWVLPYSYLVER